MVEDIECLRSELQVHGLGEIEILVEREIPGPEAGGTERIPPEVGPRPSTGDNVPIILIRGSVSDGGIGPITAISCSVQERRACYIGSVAWSPTHGKNVSLQGLTEHIPCSEWVDTNSVTSSVPVPIGIHESRLKSYRLSRLRENGSTEAESVRQSLDNVIIGMSFWKIICERQGELVPHIEVRAGAIVSEVVCILRTPGIKGTSIKLIVRIRDSVRVGVISVQGEAMTGAMREIYRTSVVDAAADRRIPRHIATKAVLRICVGVEEWIECTQV